MVIRFLTGVEHQDMRLDLVLSSLLTDKSRTKIRKIIDLGGVHVDGRRVRTCGMALSPGRRIEVHLDREPLDPYRIESSQVLYQDDYLIALNKPAGINTQPTPARYKGTLYEALQNWLGRDRRFGRKLEIGMVQRLDRDTSGLIVFSIHPRAHKPLADQMHNRRLKKYYLALVASSPEPTVGEFRSMLAKDRKTNRIRSTRTGGKEAITRYRVLATCAKSSLVEIELVTGRMHQIRAHFAEAGHPLLGDSRYGGPVSTSDWNYSHHALHSWRMKLKHPLSGEQLIFEAAPPAPLIPPPEIAVR